MWPGTHRHFGGPLRAEPASRGGLSLGLAHRSYTLVSTATSKQKAPLAGGAEWSGPSPGPDLSALVRGHRDHRAIRSGESPRVRRPCRSAHLRGVAGIGSVRVWPCRHVWNGSLADMKPRPSRRGDTRTNCQSVGVRHPKTELAKSIPLAFVSASLSNHGFRLDLARARGMSY